MRGEPAHLMGSHLILPGSHLNEMKIFYIRLAETTFLFTMMYKKQTCLCIYIRTSASFYEILMLTSFSLA